MLDLGKFKGKRLCVAFSGGVDSSALLHFLFSKQQTYGYFLSAVHCEHGLRGEDSIEDMHFAERTCKAYGVPLYIFQQDCSLLAQMDKCSLETAARQFRKSVFTSLVEEDKTDYIVTAHHQNDEAETVLFRLARGVALSGVRGMQEEDGVILRPFLPMTRAEIEDYAQQHGIAYRVDKTNFQPVATRNILRHNVLPALENAVPGAVGNLARFAHLAAQDEELLCRLSAPLIKEKEDGYLVCFSQEKPLFTRACLLAVKRLGMDKDYTSAHLQALYDLQQSEKNALCVLKNNVWAKKTDEGIFLFVYHEQPIIEKPPQKIYSAEGFDGGRYAVKVQTALPCAPLNAFAILQFDEDKLPKDAVFRFRKEGDTFEKYGGGTKRLKKFLNEKKIAMEERDFLPLLAQADGNRVYAVCGVEIAEQIKVDENTKTKRYLILQRV